MSTVYKIMNPRKINICMHLPDGQVAGPGKELLVSEDVFNNSAVQLAIASGELVHIIDESVVPAFVTTREVPVEVKPKSRTKKVSTTGDL